jgi:branched-chain amino acid transport system substrate-binding protein
MTLMVRRMLAAVALSTLVAGCGTRLDDARIEAAAGVSTSHGLGTGGDLSTGVLDAGGTAVGTGDAGTTAGLSTASAGTGGATQSAATGLATGSGTGGPAQATTGTGQTAAKTGATPAGGQATTKVASGGGPAATPGAAATGPATPGTPAPGAATKTPVVLGHIGDYSGVIGTVLKGGNVMAQVTARYINDNGGLNGHPIQLVVADAGGDPARALSLARDMVENKGVIAFLGNMWVFSGYGPREYLEQKKIPVIGGDSTTKLWFESPMYFPTAASFPSLSFGAVKGLADLGKKKVGIVYCVEAEQCKTWRDTAVAKAASVGAQVVYEAQVSLAQPDFTAECIQAQRNGAEALMTGIDSPSITRLARACAQQNYKPQFMTASLAVIEAVAKDPNLDGMMAPVGTFPHMATDLPGAQAYQAAVQRYAPSLASSPTTTTVWTAGALIREVAKQLPDQVTTAAFFPGLYAIKGNTLGGLVGPLTYNQGGPAAEIRCVYFIKVAGGKFTAPDGSKQQCF